MVSEVQIEIAFGSEARGSNWAARKKLLDAIF